MVLLFLFLFFVFVVLPEMVLEKEYTCSIDVVFENEYD